MAALPGLAPYVTAIVAYDLDMGAPGVHRGLPGTGITFELPLDEQLDVEWPGRPGFRQRAWSCLSGLHTKPAAIHHPGWQRGISVYLTVEGARAIFGMPAAELAGEIVTLPDVAPTLRHLPEALADQPDRGVQIVTNALVDTLARRGEPAAQAEVGRALARLTQGVPVAAVASDVGYSRRRLQDLVRAECGLTPKDFQRVARFARARRNLAVAARAGRTSIATVAAASGYADHAHMTREWIALGGCTPSTWLREEFPFLQDLPVVVETA